MSSYITGGTTAQRSMRRHGCRTNEALTSLVDRRGSWSSANSFVTCYSSGKPGRILTCWNSHSARLARRWYGYSILQQVFALEGLRMNDRDRHEGARTWDSLFTGSGGGKTWCCGSVGSVSLRKSDEWFITSVATFSSWWFENNGLQGRRWCELHEGRKGRVTRRTRYCSSSRYPLPFTVATSWEVFKAGVRQLGMQAQGLEASRLPGGCESFASFIIASMRHRQAYYTVVEPRSILYTYQTHKAGLLPRASSQKRKDALLPEVAPIWGPSGEAWIMPADHT